MRYWNIVLKKICNTQERTWESFFSFLGINLCIFPVRHLFTLSISVSFLQILDLELSGKMNLSTLQPVKKLKPCLICNISLAWSMKKTI